MEAKDLRIGNYVYGQWDKMVKQGRGERTQLYRIQTINPQTAEKYDPIPLTEDWLVKFGFEEKDYESPDYATSYYKHPDLDIVLGLDCQPTGTWDIFLPYELQFVHQLQNLFHTLTGSELELKTEVNQ